MTVQITFELEDEDLEHFRAIMQRARSASDNLSFEQIVATTQEMTTRLRSADLPKFVEERLDGMDRVIAMAVDQDWFLPETDRSRLVDALAYFCEPEDLIPDHIPGIGLLDDAIMMELVIRELGPELEAHQDFCEFRDRETQKDGGLANVSRSDWLDAKRAELHKQASSRRSARAQSGLFSSLFSIL